MIDIHIEITGPGLVVNVPALIVLKALHDAGYNVVCEDWASKNRLPDNLMEHAAQFASRTNIKVTVKPEPWGG